MAKADVINASANPFNKKADFTPPTQLALHNADDFIFTVGPEQFKQKIQNLFAVPILVLDAYYCISFYRDGDHLLINLELYDNNRRLVLVIFRGEITFRTNVWDFTLIGRLLTIRSKDIVANISIEFSPSMVTLKKGILYGPLGSRYEIDGTNTILDISDDQNIIYFSSDSSELVRYESSVRIADKICKINSAGAVLDEFYIEQINRLCERIKSNKLDRGTKVKVIDQTGFNCVNCATAISSVSGFISALRIYNEDETIKNNIYDRSSRYFMLSRIHYKIAILTQSTNYADALYLIKKCLSVGINDYGEGRRAVAEYLCGLIYKRIYLSNGDLQYLDLARKYLLLASDFFYARSSALYREDDSILLEAINIEISNQFEINDKMI